MKKRDPVRETCNLMVKHKDKGAQDLRLIDGRPAGMRVKRVKEFAHRIKIHGSKFIPGIGQGRKFFELRLV